MADNSKVADCGWILTNCMGRALFVFGHANKNLSLTGKLLAVIRALAVARFQKGVMPTLKR